MAQKKLQKTIGQYINDLWEDYPTKIETHRFDAKKKDWTLFYKDGSIEHINKDIYQAFLLKYRNKIRVDLIDGTRFKLNINGKILNASIYEVEAMV